MEPFAAGQQWTFAAPPGFEDARIVIGAVVRFDNRDAVVCCSVYGAPQRAPDGSVERVVIPFIPMAAGALSRTVLVRDGCGEPPAAFAKALTEWSADARGMSVFTVPFDGHLDRLIARQMAAIIGLDAA